MNYFYDYDKTTIAINYKLYGEYVALLFDKADMELLKKHTFKVYSNKYIYCTKRRLPGEYISVSRMLTNAPIGLVVDHINRNRLDNRRTNLRICTQSDNLKKMKRNKGIMQNIYLNKKTDRYYVQLKIDGKNKHIGCRKTYNEAVQLRNESVKKYYGEFACIH